MFGDRGEQHNPAEPEELYRQIRDDFYFRLSGLPVPGFCAPLANGAWLPLPRHIIRVQVTADWDTCDDGQGVEVTLDSDNVPQATTRQVVLRDPLGIATGNKLYDDTTFVVPSGTYLWAIATYDGSCPAGGGVYYEPLNFGQPPPCGSGSGSGGSGGSVACTPPAGATCTYVELEGNPGCWIEVWCTGSGGSGGSPSEME